MPIRRPQEGGDLYAIFVHAGAGYHSHQNEKIHLGAVSDAAKVGMAVLRNGGDATDAVEMAIRLLEDREITNAGYGSNLTINGIVECDATLVDHYGRSGAVGAVSQIRNPIALARIVLEESTKPLSLQRVPPNLLVGSGATDFAADFGMTILPEDFLVSANARERWYKWKQDLFAAKEKEEQKSKANPQSQFETSELAPRGSKNVISPPVSPPTSTEYFAPLQYTSRPPSTSQESAADSRSHDMSATSGVSLSNERVTSSPLSYRDYRNPEAQDWRESVEAATDDNLHLAASPNKRQRTDGSFDELDEGSHYLHHDDSEVSSGDIIAGTGPMALTDRKDDIRDTVGAIAIDCFGRIAAGSSSGGIGMKHKGRCGPAALVGIGTAIIPVQTDDPDSVSVATVTSGTGEHMATTAAAATAADRIYNSVRKDKGRLRPCSEDEAIQSIIKNDFMNHPGVRNSHCTGAIGMLAVKKTNNGIFFYFGHNTDSFALASMHSEEKKPVCTMSRSKGSGSIAQGGRVSRSRYVGRH